MELVIDAILVNKILKTVDAGLSDGMGEPRPGFMCVEAAVCYALGLDHDDDPMCVEQHVRWTKIELNDLPWKSKARRAAGLRRLAIAQLGSIDVVNGNVFRDKLRELVLSKYMPAAIRTWATAIDTSTEYGAEDQNDLEELARILEVDTSIETVNRVQGRIFDLYRNGEGYFSNEVSKASNACKTAMSAFRQVYFPLSCPMIVVAFGETIQYMPSAYRTDIYARFAEDIVQILIELKSPGCEWLHLTEVPK